MFNWLLSTVREQLKRIKPDFSKTKRYVNKNFFKILLFINLLIENKKNNPFEVYSLGKFWIMDGCGNGCFRQKQITCPHFLFLYKSSLFLYFFMNVDLVLRQLMHISIFFHISFSLTEASKWPTSIFTLSPNCKAI